ncbi:MAG TPA: cytochrome c maturation protein CcmE, partial [Myxococcota bacterium]|nr:cytochrome c maturation protein CcmE [Myxococcota bacterium]
VKPGNPLRFQLSDGTATVDVSTTEIPPQMFREGIGVVVEGTVDPNGLFTSNRMMVKHDNEYRAPKPGEAVDQEKMKREMEQLFAEGSK